MADTARAPSRGLILLSAALRRFAMALGLRGLGPTAWAKTARSHSCAYGVGQGCREPEPRRRGGGFDPAEQFDMTLPAHPSSHPRVRRALRRLSRAAGLDHDRTFALQVVVGEAINNVIEHAYGAADGILRVVARREGDAVVVEVRDHGRWRSDRPDGEQRGRGILLMRGLADSVDIRSAPSGTTVRIAVSGQASPGAPRSETEHGPLR